MPSSIRASILAVFGWILPRVGIILFGVVVFFSHPAPLAQPPEYSLRVTAASLAGSRKVLSREVENMRDFPFWKAIICSIFEVRFGIVAR